jgi:hypothetical protein
MFTMQRFVPGTIVLCIIVSVPLLFTRCMLENGLNYRSGAMRKYLGIASNAEFDAMRFEALAAFWLSMPLFIACYLWTACSDPGTLRDKCTRAELLEQMRWRQTLLQTEAKQLYKNGNADKKDRHRKKPTHQQKKAVATTNTNTTTAVAVTSFERDPTRFRPETQRKLALNQVLCKRNGARRYCRHCQVWKPDRAHHCHLCGKVRKCVIHQSIGLHLSHTRTYIHTRTRTMTTTTTTTTIL